MTEWVNILDMSPIQPYRNILLTFFHLLLYCLELIKPLVSGFHIFILLSHEPEAIILLSPLKKTDKTLSECRCKVLKKGPQMSTQTWSENKSSLAMMNFQKVLFKICQYWMLINLSILQSYCVVQFLNAYDLTMYL